MRLFIAINLTDKMKDVLLDLQGDMMYMGVHGNYTRPENLHLTLAFKGYGHTAYDFAPDCKERVLNFLKKNAAR